MSTMDRVDMLSERMAGQYKKQADLLSQLTKSRAIQRLWPEAFDHGKVKSFWTGEPVTNQESYRMSLKGLKGKAKKFTVTNGAGEQRIFKPSEVPAILNTNLLDTGV